MLAQRRPPPGWESVSWHESCDRRGTPKVDVCLSHVTRLSGLHPLRSNASTTHWAELKPAGLEHDTTKLKRKLPTSGGGLVLRPCFGGRNRNKNRASFVYGPVEWHHTLGAGPEILGYYKRKECLQGNKTKNKNPLVTKKKIPLANRRSPGVNTGSAAELEPQSSQCCVKIYILFILCCLGDVDVV